MRITSTTPYKAENWNETYWFNDWVYDTLRHYPHGGGEGYTGGDRPTRADADRIVTTKSELIQASNDGVNIAWVPDGASIYLGTPSGDTLSNITIAGSHDPIGDHNGGMIYTDQGGYSGYPRMFSCYNVRWTGLEIRGPMWNYYADINSEYPGLVPWYEPYPDRLEWSCEFCELDDASRMDNCEPHGWLQTVRGYGTPELDHNYAHDDNMTSLGYFVTSYRDIVHVHHNWLNSHRHSVNGFGRAACGYTVHDNVFGPHTSSHPVDMHSLIDNSGGSTNDESSTEYYHRGGGDCRIYNNTFLMAHHKHGPDMTNDHFQPGRVMFVYSNRGVPQPGTSVEIYDNHMISPGPQNDNRGTSGSVQTRSSSDPHAFIQDVSNHSGTLTSANFARVNFYNNHYRTDGFSPDKGVGINFDLDPSEHATETRSPLRVVLQDEDGSAIEGVTATVEDA